MTIIHNTKQRNQQKSASSDVAKLQQPHQPTWQLCPGISRLNRVHHTNQPKTKRYLCLAQAKNNLYYAKDVMSYDSKSPMGNNSALLSIKRCLILREHTNPVSGEEARAEPPALPPSPTTRSWPSAVSKYLPCLGPSVSKLSAYINTWLYAIKLPLNT